MERCAGERGKGFFWSIDPRHEHVLKKDLEKGKGKNAKMLEPALKRSVKGDTSQPLPPPLITAPHHSNPISYHAPPPRTKSVLQRTPSDTQEPGASTIIDQKPILSNVAPIPAFPLRFEMEEIPSSTKQANRLEQSSPINPIAGTDMPAIPSDIVIPIVIGSIPSANSSDVSKPIALQHDTIILNPTIFSSLTPEQLEGLGTLGAKKAIEILQSYIVRFLKEKRKTDSKEKKKSKKKKKETKEAASGAEMGNTSEAAVGVGSAAGEAISVSKSSSAEPKALSPTSDMIRSVAPLRISTPPPLDASTTLEEIDIMGEDDEPSLKRRRMDLAEGAGLA